MVESSASRDRYGGYGGGRGGLGGGGFGGFPIHLPSNLFDVNDQLKLGRL